MRSLFLKIFFLFWLSNAVVFVGAFFAFTWLADDALRQPPEPTVIAAFAVQAATIYEREGLRALRTYLAGLRRTEHLRGFLLTGEGEALAEALPAPVAAQITHYPQWIPPHANRAGSFSIGAVEVRLASGRPYRFIVTQRSLPHRRHLGRLRLGRLSLFLVASALASSLIALLVTRPLRQLRTTAQQFASGRLAARAPASVRNRTDAIGELGREFNHMAERIEQLVQTQNRLLRDVSHELRSPLARIQVAATLAQTPGGEDAGEELERIQTEVSRLNALIERLLTLTRLESGADHLARHDVDIVHLLRQVVVDAAYEYQADGKRVQLHAPERAVVFGHDAMLRSAFENILRNALRYTAPDTEVTVSLSSHASRGWRISVCDRGPGVPEAHLSRLFEPFFRSDDARDARTGSHGIGLAIARAVIERHDGILQAHNRPGGGLCVTLDLPDR